jgi:hypothetical protein
MLFRHSASLVDAVQIDGSEAALKAVLALARTSPVLQGGELEVATACGRRLARRGSWITRDATTRAVRIYDDGAFQARFEAVR